MPECESGSLHLIVPEARVVTNRELSPWIFKHSGGEEIQHPVRPFFLLVCINGVSIVSMHSVLRLSHNVGV